MKLMLWLLALSGYVITINCHLHTIVANPGGIGGIYKGPDSETIVKGPDGSVITSQERGGIVQTGHTLEPIVVAEPEILDVGPVIAPSLTEDGYIAPLIPSNTLISPGNQLLPQIEDGYNAHFVNPQPAVAPVLTPAIVAPLEPTIQGTLAPPVHLASSVHVGHNVQIIEPDPHIIETEIIEAPAIDSNESTDLVGPSGSISTRGSESIISGPASTTITKKAKVLIAPPVISGVPVVTQVLTPAYAPSLIEVNNEIPLVSSVPASPVGLIISSTVSPLDIKHLAVSSVAPPIGNPIVSSLVLPLRYDRPVLTSGPTIYPATLQQPAHLVPTQSVHLGPTGRPLFATGLLTGEQFEDETPGLVSTIVSPRGLVNTASPPLLRYPITVGSTTVSPLPAQPTSDVLVPTRLPGVSIEDEGVSGFLQPGSVYGGALPSTVSPVSSVVPPYNQDFLNYRQIGISPSNIPSRNIIPPEIRIPQGAINLGATVSSITQDRSGIPIGPGLVTNLQGVDNDNIQRIENIQNLQSIDNNVNLRRLDNQPATLEHSLQNGYYRNEILLGNRPNDVYQQSNLRTSNLPLLTNTNPIHTVTGISQEGEPYVLSGTDYQSVTPDAVLPQDYDDRITANLRNRYGRKKRTRKQ